MNDLEEILQQLLKERESGEEYQNFDKSPQHAEFIIVTDQNGIEFEHWFMLSHLSDFQGVTSGVYNYNSLKFCKVQKTFHGNHLFSTPCKCNHIHREEKGHYEWIWLLKKPFMWRYNQK